MKKPWVGVLLGALAVFVWGMASWMVLPWHDATMKKLPEEQLITDTLKTVVEEPGFYVFPSDKSSSGRMDHKEWVEKYEKGPVGVMAFSPTGKDPMGAGTFFIEFLTNLAASSIVMVLLAFCRERARTLKKRVMLSMGLGIVVCLAAHVPHWNWFSFPLGFTLVALADTVIAFGLLGLVLARFVPE